jgi:PKD domain-containing protein
MRVKVFWLGVLTVVMVCGGAGRMAVAGEKAPHKAEPPKGATQKNAPSTDLTLLKLLVITEAEPDSGPAPLKVQFKAEIYEGDDPVKPKFQWTFGDGSKSSNEQNPTHVYKKPGTYRVLVTATDVGDRTGSDTLEIDVEAPDNQ